MLANRPNESHNKCEVETCQFVKDFRNDCVDPFRVLDVFYAAKTVDYQDNLFLIEVWDIFFDYRTCSPLEFWDLEFWPFELDFHLAEMEKYSHCGVEVDVLQIVIAFSGQKIRES
jgi:hypothetical protein